MPYSPLGRGFLTGTLQKDRVQSSILAAQPRYDQHYDDNQAIVATIQDIAAECEATAAQVALAWLWRPKAIRAACRHAHHDGRRAVDRKSVV